MNAFERKPSDIFAYLRRKIHVQKLTCARVFFFVEKSVRSSPRTTLTTFTSSPSALWRRAFCYERGLSFESEQPRSIQQREQHEYTSARVRINERSSSSILKAEADTDDDVVANYVNSVTRRNDSPFLMKCSFSVKLTEEQKSWPRYDEMMMK